MLCATVWIALLENGCLSFGPYSYQPPPGALPPEEQPTPLGLWVFPVLAGGAVLWWGGFFALSAMFRNEEVAEKVVMTTYILAMIATILYCYVRGI